MNKIKIEVDLDQFNEWEQTEIMKEIFDNIDADRQEQFINNNISKASDRFIEDEYDDRDLGDDYFSDVDNIDEPRDTDYDKMTDDDRCNVLNSVLCSIGNNDRKELSTRVPPGHERREAGDGQDYIGRLGGSDRLASDGMR